ncbi:MAG: hypothetical protein DWQ51_13535 [Microcystis wesenbergii TW10]|jgi:hypothetical protein|uniref:Uncharacterized protein n=2 Tax=Microcystis TaxID=1125 RepID=A0A0A1VXM0_MICAE|nr:MULTISPECIES: hypothetical protein [Microcystis]MCZ8036627.1 hypothetical protein [Microcystis sp. LE17-20A]MCZ8212919.1 hypothetical protein [Microcystis sp. LE19-8.1F]REJ51305.1 MAG: hypothetical protein DWQ51_13535 [Microcystis wesenbergii TW10]GAL94243.1 hypothetical protein N44_02823 [Microcystis aeruginosa NIES-44]
MASLNDRQIETKDEEQVLYDYWLDRVRTDSPEELIEDFRRLFIEGRGYQEAPIYLALERLVKAKDAEIRFYYFFNRCCHILVNRWQMQSTCQPAILELVSLLDNLPSPGPGHYSTANTLRHLVKKFTLSDDYVKLQRLARIISSQYSEETAPCVGTLINRYPYLYDHCLLSDESPREQRQTVRRIKVKTERCFEVNLSHYVTYQVRLGQVAHTPKTSEEAGRIIQPVKNPTLLNDKELNRALKYYVSPIEGNYTYKALSQNFLANTVYSSTYKDFKNDLYDYLITPVDHGKGQFNKKLYDVLQNTLPQWDQQKPSEFLILRTSSQLFNYLVVESSQKPDHYIFIDMITNMGVTRTVGLLLKLVLVCPKVKPHLDKRFSILFNHYEGFSRDQVPWLVKSLESLQVAFSIHFGKADLSCLRQIQ